MDRKIMIEKLKKHYLFKHLTHSESMELVNRSRLKEIPAGTLLWSKNDKREYIVVLLEGKLKISLLDPLGNEFAIKHITPVDSLGDGSIVDNRPHMSDVVSVEDSLVLIVNKRDILRILNSNCEAAIGLCAELSARINNLTTELELQVFSRGAIRILYKLMQLKPRDSSVVKITHAQLAELVGITREKLTVILGDLEELGYIEKRRGRIIIRDTGKLEEILRDNVF